MKKMPDLVTSSIKLIGHPGLENGSAKVPIEVVVRNQGNAPAPRFKVAVEYKGDKGTFVFSFVVPGEADVWYPLTDA